MRIVKVKRVYSCTEEYCGASQLDAKEIENHLKQKHSYTDLSVAEFFRIEHKPVDPFGPGDETYTGKL